MTDLVKGKDFDIIRYPVNTEESNIILEKQNAYTFVVDKRASKPEIKKAFERVFGVKVLSVHTIVRKGKRKVFRGKIGKRIDEKRAIVRLAPDSKIDLGMGV